MEYFRDFFIGIKCDKCAEDEPEEMVKKLEVGDGASTHLPHFCLNMLKCEDKKRGSSILMKYIFENSTPRNTAPTFPFPFVTFCWQTFSSHVVS